MTAQGGRALDLVRRAKARDVTFEPTVALDNAAARAVIEFTPVERPEPIPAPDPSSAPDPADLGLPADFPLIELVPASPPAGGPLITDDPECAHASGAYRVTLPAGWWTNVAFELPDLGEIGACEYLAPAEFDPTSATPDRPFPVGAALSLRYIDGGCVGSFLATLSTRETTVDGHSASVTEYAQGVEPDDSPGFYEYVVTLEETTDCETDGRYVLAFTNMQMAGDYEANKETLDELMSTMEIEP